MRARAASRAVSRVVRGVSAVKTLLAAALAVADVMLVVPALLALLDGWTWLLMDHAVTGVPWDGGRVYIALVLACATLGTVPMWAWVREC